MVKEVKDVTADLCREQRKLVGRLNAMQAGIEDDPRLVSKTLRKIEWMEKERAVKRLHQVQPDPPSFPPAWVESREHPAASDAGMCDAHE